MPQLAERRDALVALGRERGVDRGGVGHRPLRAFRSACVMRVGFGQRGGNGRRIGKRPTSQAAGGQ